MAQITGEKVPGTQEQEHEARHISRQDRVIVLAVVTCVIVASWWLSPDEKGFGTHRQLLMLPCIFQAATHLPCPLCGLTTSFALMADGRVSDAFEVHIAGPLAFLAMTLYGLIAGISLVPSQYWARYLIDVAGTPRSVMWIFWLFLAVWPVNVYLFIIRHHPYG